jgi:hypothetical protein
MYVYDGIEVRNDTVFTPQASTPSGLRPLGVVGNKFYVSEYVSEVVHSAIYAYDGTTVQKITLPSGTASISAYADWNGNLAICCAAKLLLIQNGGVTVIPVTSFNNQLINPTVYKGLMYVYGSGSKLHEIENGRAREMYIGESKYGGVFESPVIFRNKLFFAGHPSGASYSTFRALFYYER